MRHTCYWPSGCPEGATSYVDGVWLCGHHKALTDEVKTRREQRQARLPDPVP